LQENSLSAKGDQHVPTVTEHRTPNKPQSQKAGVPYTNNSINACQTPRIIIVPHVTSLLVLLHLRLPSAQVPAWRVHVLVENVVCVAQPRSFIGRGTTHSGQPDAIGVRATAVSKPGQWSCLSWCHVSWDPKAETRVGVWVRSWCVGGEAERYGGNLR